jgi:hypothetical protein
MLKIGDYDTTRDFDNLQVTNIVKFNPQRTLCFTYVFTNFIVLDLDDAGDLQYHNSLLRNCTPELAQQIRYFKNGVELK